MYCNTTKVVWIYSLKLLCECWKLCKGLSFVTVHLCQYSLDCAVSLQVADSVTILQALVQAYLGSSDLSVVDNCSTVMLCKISYRLGLSIIVVDSRATRMGLENSDRNYCFARLRCLNLEATIFVFAAYNESLLV